MTVLTWEKPPPEIPYAEWAAYQADSTPPGTYIPNMDDGWKRRWKASMHGQRSKDLADLRVVIRKTVFGRQSYAQVLLVVGAGGSVLMSMNGKSDFSATEWTEMPKAVKEALWAMEAFKAQRAYEQLSEKTREAVERG
ncbi:MAG: hypothetical protein JWM19_903 [Actinomycetia bacterium]|nr:hypothetical protein [Actinomycetes bacterium]